jgi:hypothetical protein
MTTPTNPEHAPVPLAGVEGRLRSLLRKLLDAGSHTGPAELCLRCNTEAAAGAELATLDKASAPVPPTAAEEPPWVVAGAQLAEPWERAAKAIEVGGRPLKSVDVRCIENACRQHDAALAQERDKAIAALTKISHYHPALSVEAELTLCKDIARAALSAKEAL